MSDVQISLRLKRTSEQFSSKTLPLFYNFIANLKTNNISKEDNMTILI